MSRMELLMEELEKDTCNLGFLQLSRVRETKEDKETIEKSISEQDMKSLRDLGAREGS